MKLTTLAATVSTVLAMYAVYPYIRSIILGRTKPHQLSWMVFVIMNGIVCFSQLLAGGRGSVLISLTFFIGSVIVLALSFHYGVRDTSRWDRVLFCFALITIGVWALTRSNELAIWLTLLIDIAATAMMILKLRSHPNSEDPYPWIIASFAYVFSCLSLAGKPLSILYVRPLYGLICDVIFVAAILYFQRRARRSPEFSPMEI